MIPKITSRILRNAICVLSCLALQPWYLVAAAVTTDSASGGSSLTLAASQTADVLGIRREAEHIIALRRGQNLEGEKLQLITERAFVLRRVFDAMLQLQAAESQLEFDINYTYDAIGREQRKENAVNQAFNVANFTQAGTIGVITPVLDMNNRFVMESTLGLVSTGIGTVLPIVGMVYNKYAKASHLTPPKFMSHYINGSPVDGSNLPPLVMRYLNSSPAGKNVTRRDELNAIWKQRFKADINKKETLYAINDGKSRSQGYLHNRLVLLWSLYTTIEEFDSDLLAFLNEVRGVPNVEHQLTKTKFNSSEAEDAARLLHIEPLLAELKTLNASGADSERKRELQIALLEHLIAGSLEMSVASDKCQKELNYQFDVVLAELTDRQASFMQKLYEANFIQGGAINSVAGLLFLKHKPNPAGELFLVSGGIGLCLTAVSFLALHGGWRKNQTGPNSLADFFNVRPDHGFSPLVYEYLNSASPKRADGKTRKECLLEYWSTNAVATIDLKNRKNQEKLASMPSCKWDTIKLVLNRISLLSSLREQYNEFDGELLDLLRTAWPVTLPKTSIVAEEERHTSVEVTAKLLGVQSVVTKNQPIDENTKLLVTRQVLDGFLAMTADANVIGQEVDLEFKVLDRMERHRDKLIQLTNNVNFLQAGTLGLIAGSLGLAGTDADVLATNKISIVSSAIGSGLAIVTILEQRGGWRPGKAKPNALGTVFGKDSEHKFSPVTIRFLNTVEPDSSSDLSRRQVLIKYWKSTKLVNVDVGRESVIQKLCAQGAAHRWWSETIRLINNRVTMLFDLRAVMRSSNIAFGELIEAVD